MRVLAACSLGGLGHLNPLLDVADAARDLGADVLVVAPGFLAHRAAERGLRVLEAPEPDDGDLQRIRDVITGADRSAASLAGVELFTSLAAPALAPTLHAMDFSPDLVIRETCEYASAVWARTHHVREVQVAIGLAEVEWSAIDIGVDLLDQLDPGLSEHVRTTTYLTSLHEAFDHSPFPDTVRFRRERRAEVDPLPDWWPGDDRPLLYATLGSVAPRTATGREAFHVILDAIAELPYRVLLTTGIPLDLGEVPSNVHVETHVDQERIFPEATLVLCHGGSGTLYGSLEHGVPLVVWPQLADNFRNARLVESVGAGTTVLGADLTVRVTAEQLRQEIRHVVLEPRFTQAARRHSTAHSTVRPLRDAMTQLLHDKGMSL